MRYEIYIAGLIILIAWGAWRLYRHQTRMTRRLRLLLEALDSADTTLRFPTSTDRRLNEFLNRIARSLAALRMKVIETEKYYETITDSIATGVIVITSSGHVILANPSALRLLGRPALTHISSLNQSWSELAELLSTPTAGIDTTIRNIAIKTTSFTRHDGQQLTLVTLDDISAQLAAASVETWEEMTRVLTHEIMNGIAPVISLSETLRLRHTLDHPDSSGTLNEDYLTHGLDAISDSSRSLKEFVGNYRRLTIIPTPSASDFPLRPLLDHVITIAHTIAHPDDSGKHAEFTLYLPTYDPIIHADRSQISQVLINLIKNAIEASATEITIRVSVPMTHHIAAPQPSDNKITVEICNNGTPITAETAHRIFTPLFTTKQGGNGIGLSLSRRMILANHGTLVLKSAPGQPTIFALTLPLAEAE
ncbi:MAG: ATP-binding protein [Bacteroides sp.]|nr:ATP-binding protein [Bacteroides sp.]